METTFPKITKNESRKTDQRSAITFSDAWKSIGNVSYSTLRVEPKRHESVRADFPETVTLNTIVETSFSSDITTLEGALSSKKKWRNKEYRHAYAVAAVEQGIAWQCKLNREARRLSQQDLAKMIGTKQSSISRMEDPEYGAHSLPTLLKVAHAFDCALLVKLVPFSVLAAESRCLSADSLIVRSFSEEAGE